MLWIVGWAEQKTLIADGSDYNYDILEPKK